MIENTSAPFFESFEAPLLLASSSEQQSVPLNKTQGASDELLRFEKYIQIKSKLTNTPYPYDPVEISGLDIGLLYDETYYLKNHPDVAAAVASSFFRDGYSHFISHGWLEGRNPSPLYNEDYYLDTNPDVAKAVEEGIAHGGFQSGLHHFILYGHKEARDPSALFDQDDYLLNHPNAAAAVNAGEFSSGLDHWLERGSNQGQGPALTFFQEAFYLAQNPDVKAAVDAGNLESGYHHYLLFGINEGRNPNPNFDESSYMQLHSDVKAAVEAGNFPSGAAHYILYGRAEGRETTLIDTAPPHPTLTATDLTSSQSSTYQFSVTYSDATAVDLTTLDSNDIVVQGPNGFSQAAAFVNIRAGLGSKTFRCSCPACCGKASLSDSLPSSTTAVYQIKAPGNTWTSADNGTYSIVLKENQVKDTLGNTAASQTLGAFQVDIGSLIKGGIRFSEATNAAGVDYNGLSFGSSWGDFNGDGYDDLWVNNHFSSEKNLFLNQRDGTFEDVSATVFNTPPKGDTHGAAWADFDNDGDLDLIQLRGGSSQTGPGQANLLYVNTNGVLVKEGEQRGVAFPRGRARTPVWYDYNGDLRLDLWLGNLKRKDGKDPPTFLKQNQANTFAEASQEVGIDWEESRFSILVDLNGDGHMELLNDGFDPATQRRLNVYDMASTPFKTITKSIFPSGFNPRTIVDIAAADFNNDGLMDLYLTGRSDDYLLMNNGERLVNMSEAAGINAVDAKGVSVVAGDFDNDMDVDIYVLTGNQAKNTPNLLYQNQGDGAFVLLEDAGGAAGTNKGFADTVTVADYDRDGFLDLFTTNGFDYPVSVKGPNQLFRNQGNSNNWIELNLQGVTSNADGIGARVYVTAGGVTQLREQNSGMHKWAQNSSVLHFGLGNHEAIDEIVIEWPDGSVQSLNNIQANQRLNVPQT